MDITFTAAIPCEHPVIVQRVGAFGLALDVHTIPVPDSTPEFGPYEGPECHGKFYRVELARLNGRLYWQAPGGAGTGEGVYPLSPEEEFAAG